MKKLKLLSICFLMILGVYCFAFETGTGIDSPEKIISGEIFSYPNFQYGFCIANDFSVFTFPKPESDYDPGNEDEDVPDYSEKLNVGKTEYLANALGLKNLYFIRVDFSLAAQLAEKTNFYYLMALRILDQDSGAQDGFSYTLLQAELEHTIGRMYRFRLGRLAEKFSESRFFARVALGYKDSHVWGRTPFVNDSLELNLDSVNTGLPVNLTTGIKFGYKPFEFTTLFFITELQRKKFKSYLIYTFNMQYEENLTTMFPWIEEDRYYHGLELEVALKLNGVTPYLNAGVLIDYIGTAPHYSGPTDILKGNQPIIYYPNESREKTFIPMAGVKFEPYKLSNRLSFFKEAVLEFEYPGIMDDTIDTYNTYFHIRFDFWEIQFQYGLFVNLIRFENKDTPLFDSSHKLIMSADALNSFVHFFRVSKSF
ncbi:MAG TPA: hypothetical protein ENN73_04715 [Firmicutes bacterium]|nr:hypothetical protein [Bacillota bacterium]